MTNVDVATENQGPLLEFIEEAASIGTWVWELEADTFYWSRQMFVMIGVDPATTIPSFELYSQVVHPEDRLDFSNRSGVARGGQLDEREFRIIRPNGTVRWIRSYGRLLHRKDGAAWKMIGFAQDVTEARANRIGHAAQDALSTGIRALTEAQVWITGSNGNLIEEAHWWNVARRGMLSVVWPRSEAIHPDDVAPTRDGWARAVSERRSYQGSFRLNVGGHFETFVAHAQPIVDARGTLLGWAGLSLQKPDDDISAASARHIPGPLIRAARAYLGYSVQKLAEVSRLSSSTIRRMEEGGAGQVTRDSEDTLVRAFRNAGIDFYIDRMGLPQLHIAVPH